MSKNCNCNYEDYCTCNCPEACIINEIAESEAAEDSACVELDLIKDRSLSRKRHHNSVKAKKRSLVTASILCSKANKIPSKAEKALHKANLRADNAVHKSKHFKNSESII